MRQLGSAFLGSSVFVTLIWFLTLISGKEGAAVYYSPSDLGAANYEQLNSLLRDYLKVLEKIKIQQPKPISGQVNLRAPRSELVGDMAHALRLYQLAELDRMYGAKSRPRFGKRSEITSNYAPVYGSEFDNSASSNDNSAGAGAGDDRR